mgnify:FL=1
MKFWKEFKALGTDMLLLADCGMKEYADIEINKAEKNIREFESRFSRFVKGNELDELNNKSELKVSEEMRSLLVKAEEAYGETGGIFDPTVITTLENIGYRESFGEGERSTGMSSGEIRKIFFKREKFDTLEIDGGHIKKPKDLRIEFGGIGKGYLVDMIAGEFGKKFKNFWVSAGGDIFISGKDNDANWKIGVQHPTETDKDIAVIESKN